MFNKLNCYILFIACILLFTACNQVPVKEEIVQERIPAFPGAQGYGSYTVGGRGGRVIEVTNLNNDGPGSLRAALRVTVPRIITFRVSGIIRLKSAIFIDYPFVTVAGQTAPGDGICIKGSQITIRTHDVVIRYIRIRPGDEKIGTDPENRDALTIGSHIKENVYNIIIDHCSFSWAIDGTIDLWNRPNDLTIQNSIISESLRNSSHPNGAHGTAILISEGSRNISIHHNLFAHNMARVPLIINGTSVVLVNNIIYDWGKEWGGRATHITQELGHFSPLSAYIDIINNFYKVGYNGGDICIEIDTGMPDGTEIYVNGNVGTISQSKLIGDSNGEWNIVKAGGLEAGNDQKILNKYKSLTQWNEIFTKYDSALESYNFVLDNAGAVLPKRDEIDKRVVNDVRNGTGRIIDSQSEVGGWPELESLEPPRDTDHDGMPDEWELKHGLNPFNRRDGSEDRDSDGYSNVEEYLFSSL